MTPTAQALAEVLALAELATPDWHLRNGRVNSGVIVGGPFHEYTNGRAQSQVAMFCHMADDENAQEANASLTVAAVNFIRTHGPALLAQLGGGREVPDGWVLVPIEATDAMQEAGCSEAISWDACLNPNDTRDIYRAMLAATPTEPAQAGRDGGCDG